MAATYTESRVLGYTPEQVFDLVADVESYPEFVPWWVAARIRNREPGAYSTDQIIGFGPIRLRFRSRTVVERPERIEVTSRGGPFRNLGIQWTFEPTPEGGCRTAIRVAFELRAIALERLLALPMGGAVRRVVGALEGRARRVYGPPRLRP